MDPLSQATPPGLSQIFNGVLSVNIEEIGDRVKFT